MNIYCYCYGRDYVYEATATATTIERHTARASIHKQHVRIYVSHNIYIFHEDVFYIYSHTQIRTRTHTTNTSSPRVYLSTLKISLSNLVSLL